MKQITYEFDLFNIMYSLMRDREEVEDGYYQMYFQTETVSPVLLPQMFQGQIPATLPSVIIRMNGVRITKVQENSGPMTIEIRDGLVCPEKGPYFDGLNPNNNRPIESGEGA